MKRPVSARFNSEAGIAIGMILFVIAIMAVIGTAISASGNFIGSTITPDRVIADIKAQTFLIRSKILECYTLGFDRGDLSDKYPLSTGTGTLVEELQCLSYASGQQSLWSGQSPATLPPPPAGFNKWYYKNAGSTGGRCIRIQPLTASATDTGIRAGLAQVATNFSDVERVYTAGSSSQRFIIWITAPTSTPDTDCSP
jgi:hypothetical protein